MRSLDQSAVDRQAALLWREAREHGWRRALDLTLSWSAPSAAAANAFRARLAAEHGLRLEDSDHLGPDASASTVSARLHLPESSAEILRTRLEWALDLARAAGVKVIATGVGAHED